MNNNPGDAFHVEKRAQEKFDEIATRTRGWCEMLDINSSLGSNMLTDLVTEEILNNIAGHWEERIFFQHTEKNFQKVTPALRNLLANRTMTHQFEIVKQYLH
jgi:hypothetical protein